MVKFTHGRLPGNTFILNGVHRLLGLTCKVKKFALPSTTSKLHILVSVGANCNAHPSNIQLVHTGKSKSILLRSVNPGATEKLFISQDKPSPKDLPEIISQEALPSGVCI
ncbi:TPA: hypothetical protein DIC40_06090 [Patescibacteria group bacterium]|nr:hypothetical protein [Candidatus Gracilibacteria bacterium]